MLLEDLMNLVYSIYEKENVKDYTQSLSSGRIEIQLAIDPNKFIALALGLELLGICVIRRYYKHSLSFSETADCLVTSEPQTGLIHAAGFSTSRERFYWGDIKQGD